MGQRNMMCTSQMTDLELDQQAQSQHHPEPRVILGSAANLPQHNIHTILPSAGNTANFNTHHLPDSHENTSFYGMPQYSGFQHLHPVRNFDMGITTASNYYNPHMTPSGTGVFPLPLNQGSYIQLPSSSNGGVVGVPTDAYRMNNHLMDGVSGSFKRKDAEGMQGGFQYGNASVGSSSAIAPLNTRPSEPRVTLMDVASFPVPEFRGNDIPSFMDVRSHRSVTNRSGAIGLDSVVAHGPNHLIQANYSGLPFQTANPPWLDQNFNNYGTDGATLAWSQAPAITYLHGSSINGGCSEAGNMSEHLYQETASNRSSTTFPQLPPVHHGHPNLYHLPQPAQGVRGQNINFFSQVSTPSQRLPTDTSHASVNPVQDGMELRPRYLGPVPPTGLRMYRPHRREHMPEATVRHQGIPRLRVLPADEIAMLEISGYYEVGNSLDHHRDMRLDIDHMSYEELLALGEQIGSVVTGLSEETISSYLKTRTYVSCTTSVNLEDAACVDHETDFCVICQNDYKKQEKIGTLDCGHEYHVDCVKRWLLIKNTCPICKSSALKTERKGSRREG